LRPFFIFLAILSVVFIGFSSASAVEIKKYLFVPAFQISESNGFLELRIQQRTIIRILRTRRSRASGLVSRGGQTNPTKFEEQKIGKCVAMDKLTGFSLGPRESLEFVTKDRHIIRAYLGDECLAREFYAGAYIERSNDGKLCRKRDIIHARSGAKCELDRFRLLVPETS